MRKSGWIAATALGLAFAGAAAAQDAAQSPAPKPARVRPPYDVDKDPCGPVIKTYCAEGLAKMDHPVIHACLMAHVDLLPNTCRSTMAMPRPPLREEDANGNPIAPPKG